MRHWDGGVDEDFRVGDEVNNRHARLGCSRFIRRGMVKHPAEPHSLPPVLLQAHRDVLKRGYWAGQKVTLNFCRVSGLDDLILSIFQRLVSPVM